MYLVKLHVAGATTSDKESAKFLFFCILCLCLCLYLNWLGQVACGGLRQSVSKSDGETLVSNLQPESVSASKSDQLFVYFVFDLFSFPFKESLSASKGADSFHIHRKTMKDLWILAVLGVQEACFPIVYEHVHIHTC